MSKPATDGKVGRLLAAEANVDVNGTAEIIGRVRPRGCPLQQRQWGDVNGIIQEMLMLLTAVPLKSRMVDGFGPQPTMAEVRPFISPYP